MCAIREALCCFANVELMNTTTLAYVVGCRSTQLARGAPTLLLIRETVPFKVREHVRKILLPSSLYRAVTELELEYGLCPLVVEQLDPDRTLYQTAHSNSASCAQSSNGLWADRNAGFSSFSWWMWGTSNDGSGMHTKPEEAKKRV